MASRPTAHSTEPSGSDTRRQGGRVTFFSIGTKTVPMTDDTDGDAGADAGDRRLAALVRENREHGNFVEVEPGEW